MTANPCKVQPYRIKRRALKVIRYKARRPCGPIECEACPHLAQTKESPAVTGLQTEEENDMSTAMLKRPAAALVSGINDKALDPPSRWETITPELAAEYLKLNTLNRPKKPQKIKLYTADLLAGRWPITGATIQFGQSGRLLDGQNRLQAIIDSGVSARMLIVEGLRDDIFDVIDRGSGRSSSDILVILGYEGWIASTGAAAVQVASNLWKGYYPYSNSLSPQSVREFVTDNPAVMESVAFLSLLPRKGVPIIHSAGAALHFLMAKKSASMADTLIQRMYLGNDMTADDVVLRLRNALLARDRGQGVRSTLTSNIGGVVKVWNALRAGRNIVHINNAFPRSDEPFPEVK